MALNASTWAGIAGSAVLALFAAAWFVLTADPMLPFVFATLAGVLWLVILAIRLVARVPGLRPPAA